MRVERNCGYQRCKHVSHGGDVQLENVGSGIGLGDIVHVVRHLH